EGDRDVACRYATRAPARSGTSSRERPRSFQYTARPGSTVVAVRARSTARVAFAAASADWADFAARLAWRLPSCPNATLARLTTMSSLRVAGRRSGGVAVRTRDDRSSLASATPTHTHGIHWMLCAPGRTRPLP